MKHNMRWMCLLLLTGLVACQEKTSTSSSSGGSSGGLPVVTTAGSTGGSTTSGTTTGGSTTSGTTTGGSTTSGTTTGGSTTGGTSTASFKIDVVMSGGKPWSYGEVPFDFNSDFNSTGYTAGDFFTLNSNTANFVTTDSVFKARVRVKDEPVVTGSLSQKLLCSQRSRSSPNNCVVNGQNRACAYTRLSYKVAIRDIYVSGSTYTLGLPYATRTISNQSLNTTSPVMDWSQGIVPGLNPVGPQGQQIAGYSLYVFDVQSNNACLSSPTSSSCPMAVHPTKACWNIEIELATDNIPSF